MLIKKNNISNHFYSMIEDNEYAMEYLLSKNIQEFTNQKLIELKKERQKLKFKLKKIRFYFEIAEKLKNEKLGNKIWRKRESLKSRIQIYDNKIDLFESDLFALILFEVIDMKKVKELGYESKNIKFLLEKYRKKTTRRFAGYFYNESLKEASLITESGRHLILQHVPFEIEGQYKRKINEPRGLGNNRYRKEVFH